MISHAHILTVFEQLKDCQPATWLNPHLPLFLGCSISTLRLKKQFKQTNNEFQCYLKKGRALNRRKGVFQVAEPTLVPHRFLIYANGSLLE